MRTRIARAKEAFSKKRELLTKRMNHKIRKKMIKTLVWSIALYASETWTLRKEEYRKLDALEMWLWRRMEKVSWTQRKTNEEILRMVGEKRRLVNMVVERKKRWIGHSAGGWTDERSDGGTDDSKEIKGKAKVWYVGGIEGRLV